MKGGLKSGQREVLETKVLQPLREGYDWLTKTEKKLAGYLLSRPDCLGAGDRLDHRRQCRRQPDDRRPLPAQARLRRPERRAPQLKADLYGPDGGQPVVDRPPLPGLRRREEAHFTPAGQPGGGAGRDPPGL